MTKIKKDPLQGSKKDQSYFKVYTSLFEKETYVTNLTDLEKVMLIFISSELNTKKAEEKTAGKAAIMRFSHYWLSAALSTNRQKLPKPLKSLAAYGFFKYTGGYYVSDGRTAPSTITDLAAKELYTPIDRYTFEYLLLNKLKNKEIKYRHIVVYALCKYIEQFRGGTISVNEFGRMLGMTVKVVNYSRIKPHLEDLQAMKLINFQREHGKVTNIEVAAMPIHRGNRQNLRENIRIEAEEKRYAEHGINQQTAAAVEDMPTAENLDDILNSVKDIYTKRTGKKAVLTAEQKRRIQKCILSLKEIEQISIHFFKDESQSNLIYRTDGKTFFGLYANYLLVKQLEKSS